MTALPLQRHQKSMDKEKPRIMMARALAISLTLKKGPLEGFKLCFMR